MSKTFAVRASSGKSQSARFVSSLAVSCLASGIGACSKSGERGVEPAAGTSQSVTAIDQVSDDMSPATVAEG